MKRETGENPVQTSYCISDSFCRSQPLRMPRARRLMGAMIHKSGDLLEMIIHFSLLVLGDAFLVDLPDRQAAG